MSEWTDEMLDYTGCEQFNAVYTITIGELFESGVFDWSNPLLYWKDAAYDANQYQRVCDYFIERFYYREISIEPFLEWANMFHRKMVYEVMPKYKPLYDRVKEGISPFANEDEYYKSRVIDSSYPQTLLSGNSDYLTSGRDEEFERIKEGNTAEMISKFAAEYHAVDELLLDEFESMFICMYTLNINGSW